MNQIQKIGIVGLGMIANGRHIPELLNVENCIITAICDIDENKLKSVGDSLNIPNQFRFNKLLPFFPGPFSSVSVPH